MQRLIKGEETKTRVGILKIIVLEPVRSFRLQFSLSTLQACSICAELLLWLWHYGCEQTVCLSNKERHPDISIWARVMFDDCIRIDRILFWSCIPLLAPICKAHVQVKSRYTKPRLKLYLYMLHFSRKLMATKCLSLLEVLRKYTHSLKSV